MPNNNTPTAVRVARWSAIAAAITAAGSFLNTMWTSAPWWVSTKTETMELKSVELDVAAEAMSSFSSDDAASQYIDSIAVSATEVSPSLVDSVVNHIQRNPISMALVGACLLVIVWSLFAEYRHRKSCTSQ